MSKKLILVADMLSGLVILWHLFSSFYFIFIPPVQPLIPHNALYYVLPTIAFFNIFRRFFDDDRKESEVKELQTEALQNQQLWDYNEAQYKNEIKNLKEQIEELSDENEELRELMESSDQEDDENIFGEHLPTLIDIAEEMEREEKQQSLRVDDKDRASIDGGKTL